eukprot:274886-Pyramimonas_sp.AAC.1
MALSVLEGGLCGFACELEAGGGPRGCLCAVCHVLGLGGFLSILCTHPCWRYFGLTGGGPV